eukprot:9484446-Pyramimonas_sp.AAC.1
MVRMLAGVMGKQVTTPANGYGCGAPWGYLKTLLGMSGPGACYCTTQRKMHVHRHLHHHTEGWRRGARPKVTPEAATPRELRQNSDTRTRRRPNYTVIQCRHARLEDCSNTARVSSNGSRGNRPRMRKQTVAEAARMHKAAVATSVS